jgi:hypothetical protein
MLTALFCEQIGLGNSSFGVEIIPKLFYKSIDGEKGACCFAVDPFYESWIHRIVKDALPRRVLVGDNYTAHIQGGIHSL